MDMFFILAVYLPNLYKHCTYDYHNSQSIKLPLRFDIDRSWYFLMAHKFAGGVDLWDGIFCVVWASARLFRQCGFYGMGFLCILGFLGNLERLRRHGIGTFGGVGVANRRMPRAVDSRDGRRFFCGGLR